MMHSVDAERMNIKYNKLLYKLPELIVMPWKQNNVLKVYT